MHRKRWVFQRRYNTLHTRKMKEMKGIKEAVLLIRYYNVRIKEKKLEVISILLKQNTLCLHNLCAFFVSTRQTVKKTLSTSNEKSNNYMKF